MIPNIEIGPRKLKWPSLHSISREEHYQMTARQTALETC
jgi:hypothetical protein